MQISINTQDATTADLTALIALCASLGGRLPQDWRNNPMPRQTVPDDSFAEEYPVEHTPTVGPNDGALPADSSNDAPPPPPPAATDSAVDSKGIPWDARIHSESKATNADKTWRKRRGVDDQVYADVLAELSGQTPPPPPADEQSGPNDDTPPPPPSSAPTAAEPSEPVAAANVTAAGEAAKPGAFEAFPAFVSAVSKHGKSYAELNELAVMVGAPAFKDMKDHADKWDAFFAML